MADLAITRLRLSQFRSHAKAELALDPRPVAIYGPNGVGKTNILEAVSLLSPGRGLRRAAADDMARSQAGVGWKVAAELTSLNQSHEIETSYQPNSARQVSINAKPASQTALGRITRMLWLVPSMDRLWIEGADGRRRFLDRMTLSFEPAHAEATLTYDKAMRERNRLLKDQISDPAWYRALEAQMAQAGAAVIANRKTALARVIAAQTGAQSAFPAAEAEIVGPDETDQPTDQDALAQAFAHGRSRDMAAGRTLTGPHRDDLSATYVAKSIPARQCSTGEQKALLISLILANALALAEEFGAPPILLLDEIAAHLDKDRRAALYKEICTLGAQAWMTGTERHLFAELDARAQFIEVREDKGQSETLPENP